MTAAAPPIASVDGLTFLYPGKRALDAVSLRLNRGSITALVGPNGAGKTTLMRCLAALETPFAGRIEVDGILAETDPRGVHRRVGFLQDFFGLYDDLSVARCLAFHAAARGVPPDARSARIAWAAERLGLEDRMADAARTLSRGLRQRLAIAQTILHQPPLLILDEPASGLDPDARDQLAHLLRDLRDQGMTLLVSSHILAELDAYATEMLILRDGRVVDHVPLTEIGSRTRIDLQLAAAVDGLAAILGAIEGVTPLESSGDWARIEIADDLAAQAALLARLIGAGLPVAGFAPARETLMQAYQDRSAQRTTAP